MLKTLNTIIFMLLSVGANSTASAGEETVDQSEQPSVKKTENPLQTDEEQILQLLADHDDLLTQMGIAAKTGFSESKTSRLLCAMEDAGKISRTRVGRKKISTLSDSDK